MVTQVIWKELKPRPETVLKVLNIARPTNWFVIFSCSNWMHCGIEFKEAERTGESLKIVPNVMDVSGWNII